MKCELTIFSTGFYLLLSFLILLCLEGYVFGTGDQSEMLAYAAYLRDNSLFSHDFYIQSIVHEVPNERWLFSALLALMGDQLEIPAFLAFSISTLFLLLSLYRITCLFLDYLYTLIPWLIALAVIIPLNGISLGENELYYNVFLPGTLALSIGSWSWYYWLKNYAYRPCLLLVAATLIHPMSGFHIFLLITGSTLIFQVRSKQKPDIKAYFPIALYLLIVAPWLYFILLRFGQGELPGEKFMEIIRFRLAHHFIPSVFALKNYLIIGGLFLPAMIILLQSDKEIFLWWHRLKYTFLIILSGITLYTIGIELFNAPVFITSQWFSTTLWLKTFSILVMATYLIKFIKNDILILVDKSLLWILPVVTIICLLSALAGFSFFEHREYQFPWNEISPDKEIAIKCGRVSDNSALFLVPPDFTPVPYYSKRSNFISYKQMVHKKKIMGEWYQLIREMYAVNEAGEITNQMPLLKKNWANKEVAFFKEKAGKYGITHVLTYQGHKLPLEKLAENSAYVVYKF